MADDVIIMRSVLRCVVVAAGLLPVVGVATAQAVVPQPASAFRDSVGVSTHIVYYDTPYGDWPKVVQRLQQLGVRHVRDGVYANPAPQWRDWNERSYRAVELAARAGMRFDFGLGRPGSETGTLDQLLDVVGGRLRGATDALEAPNEFDHFVGGRRWPSELAAYGRELYRQAKARPALRALPVIGPSLMAPGAPRRLGDQHAFLDAGNIHPYTGGLSPAPAHMRSELARMSSVSGRKPVWATEAGFQTAVRSRDGQPPVSEKAGAVYLLRTFLEHFISGVRRTYAYELLDESAEPALRKSEQHFGLLRHDFSPKPAYTALRNLLALMGPDQGRAARPRPVRLGLPGRASGVRHLVLQRADGTVLVALWRLDSVWDRTARRDVRVKARVVAVAAPGAASVRVSRPVAGTASGVPLRGGRVRVGVAGDPLVLEVSPRAR